MSILKWMLITYLFVAAVSYANSEASDRVLCNEDLTTCICVHDTQSQITVFATGRECDGDSQEVVLKVFDYNAVQDDSEYAKEEEFGKPCVPGLKPCKYWDCIDYMCGGRNNPSSDWNIDCPFSVGDSGYCFTCGPCGLGEGLCTRHNHCKTGLMCDFVTGTCVRAVAGGSNGCAFPQGHPDYCFSCGPCPNGVGGCNRGYQCISGYCDLSTNICRETP